MEKNKNILLTIDYELFFGPNSGSVEQCMIKPTKKLIQLCKTYNCSMTVFWDILHYYRLLELEAIHPSLKQDRMDIENQIEDLIVNGHDLQLHIHPHWLDSNFVNKKWSFNYKRFSLHQLSSESNDDINSISGCIRICKGLLEKITHKFDPNHKVNTIRAGGYLIEPFEFLREALIKNGIVIDSSVCPNRKVLKDSFSFDFTNYPTKRAYHFEFSPSVIDTDGSFLEIPIQSVYISPLRRFWYQSLKKIRKSHRNRFGDGRGNTLVASSNEKNKIKNKVKKLLTPEYSQLTTDNCVKEKYLYLLKKSNNYSVQILHPKLMTENSIEMMSKQLKEGKINFLSIKDFIKQQEN